MDNCPPPAPVRPVERFISIKASPTDAFRAFAFETAQWWPIAQHSIDAENTDRLVLEPWLDGAVYQVQKDGRQLPWGRVTTFDPPNRLVLAWHIGFPAENASTVTVNFINAGDGMTDVHLIHAEFENLSADEAENLRTGYDMGWINVFEVHFQEYFD